MLKYSLQPCIQADIPQLAALKVEIFAMDMNAARFGLRDLFVDERSVSYCAKDENGNILGFACATHGQCVSDFYIAVAKEYRRQGIGTALLKQIESVGVDYDILDIQIESSNKEALIFLLKHDFEILELYHRQGESRSNILLQKWLKG